MERLTKIKEINALGYTEEEKTQIIIKLSKLEDLEENVGCPLEVKCQMHVGSIIVDSNGNNYSIITMFEKYFYASKEPYNGNIVLFYYKDHNKTWWLNADRSE